jgi:hypothetical protein
VTDPVVEVVTAEVEEAVAAEAVVVNVAVTADPEMLLVITSKLPPQPNEHL